MPKYIALVYKDPDTDYGVHWPDFPGCVSAGRTLEEAKEMAHEALGMHVDWMRQGGDPIPEPSTFETIIADPENADALAFILVEGNAPPPVL